MNVHFTFFVADCALVGGYLMSLVFFAWSFGDWRYGLSSAITLVTTFCANIILIGYSMDLSVMIRSGEIIP